MSQQHPMVQLLHDDRRYSLEAYQFIRDALSYGQRELGFGEGREMDDSLELENPFLSGLADEDESDSDDDPQIERHVSGQQLCEAVRQHALEQYGYMAKVVLNNWGIQNTGDIGEVVYNLIRVGMMKKSDEDRREDFEACYDFSEAFEQHYEITMPKE